MRTIVGGNNMIETSNEIANKYVKMGYEKTLMPLFRMLLLAIFGGIFIALAAVGANTASSLITNPSLARLVSALIFPAGLAMVILTGAELFTGSSLMIILVLEKKTRLLTMLRCWIIIYIGNFIGAVIVALGVSKSGQLGLFSGDLAVTTVNIAATKTSLGFSDAVILGIFCNFLVCIAIWMSYAGKTVTDKIIGMYLPLLLFVVSGFEHCVANMYYIPAGILAKHASEYSSVLGNATMAAEHLNMKTFLVGNMIPVTLGNMIGGSLIIGAGYWYLYLHQDKPK